VLGIPGKRAGKGIQGVGITGDGVDEGKGRLVGFASELGRLSLLAFQHNQIGNPPAIECIRQAY
jgi:hypothetical protein